MTPEQEAQQKQRRDDCRREVLAFLANRNHLAFTLKMIRKGIHRDTSIDYGDELVLASLTILDGLSDVAWQYDPYGSEKYYRATAAGTLNYERSSHP